MAKKEFTKTAGGSSWWSFFLGHKSSGPSSKHAARYGIVASGDCTSSALSSKPTTTSTVEASFRRRFVCCFKSSSHPEVESLDDAVSVESDYSISGNKSVTNFPTRAASKSEAAKAFFRTWLKRCFSVCSKSSSNPEVDSHDVAVSAGSDYSISGNKSVTISAARAACRAAAEDDNISLSPIKHAGSVGSSLGRRLSDSSSDDGIEVRARGRVITTLVCVHKVDSSDYHIVV